MDVNFIFVKENAFGHYIFLIIIGVASIIKVIVQENKKDEAQRAERRKQIDRELEDEEQVEEYPVEREEGGSIFDRMEKMLMPELPPKEIKPKVQQTVASKKEAASVKYDIQNYKMYEGENTEPPKIESNKKSVEPKKQVRPGIAQAFNLKKAVIYSEVLNRKYF